MAANYYGLDVSKVKNPGGKWFSQYIAPNTSSTQRNNLYKTFGTRYGWMTPTVVSAAHKPQTTTTATNPVVENPAVQQPQPVEQPVDTSGLFPGAAAGVKADPNLSYKSVSSFIPQDITADPIYNWQKQQGMKSLDQYMASRGLTNSSYEGDQTRNFINQLGADQAARMTDIAKTDSSQGNQFNLAKYGSDLGVQQAEANRLAQLQKGESDRQYAVGNDNWNRLMQVMGLLSAASPVAAGNNALSGLSSILSSMAGLTSDAYGKIGLIPSSGSSSSSSITPFNPFGLMDKTDPNQNYVESGTDLIQTLIDAFR